MTQEHLEPSSEEQDEERCHRGRQREGPKAECNEPRSKERGTCLRKWTANMIGVHSFGHRARKQGTRCMVRGARDILIACS